jgi:hypothetical protein
MDGLSEMQKVQLILKTFSDADKVRISDENGTR